MNRLLVSCVVCASLIATGCASLTESLPQSVDDVVFDRDAYAQDKKYSFEKTLSFHSVEITDAYSSIIATFSDLRGRRIAVTRADYPSVILAANTVEFGEWFYSLGKHPRAYGIYLKPVHGGVQFKVLIRGKETWFNYDDKEFIERLVKDVENKKKPSRLLPEALIEVRHNDHLTFPISVQDVSFDPEYHGEKTLFGILPYEEVADFASYDTRSVFLAAIHSIERRGFIVQQGIYPSVLIALQPYAEGYDSVGVYIRSTSEGVQVKIIYAGVIWNQLSAEKLIANMRAYLSSDSQATDPRHRYFEN